MDAAIILKALSFGLLSASSLVIGASLGYFLNFSKKIIATSLSYGSGVLIAAVCFSQIPEARHLASTAIVLLGLFLGTIVFILAGKSLSLIQKRNASKKSNSPNSNIALLLAIGALLDGIPESLSLGLGFLDGGELSHVLLIAIFLSNLPEGLSSASSMKQSGKSASQIFCLWGGIALVCSLSAAAAPLFLHDVNPMILGFIIAFSAGAILCMVVDSMIIEAFETTHDWTGLVFVLGFITAYAIH
ncbi:ZIP family metal transporter [Thorsellia kenyensis]|uniref:ZIP family metal transporter n=1 Tax=Thorsellia kenyensis TaxID=1549888 RepID=A0ABV6C9F7_9GAMM